MKVFLKGIGAVGGFGTGIQSLKTALLNLGPIAETLTAGGPQTPEGQAFAASDIREIQNRFPVKSLRRIDHFSRMALLAAALALEDAGNPDVDDRMGIIVATGYGAARTTFAFLDSVLEGGDACASPTLFSGSVHNAAAAHLSMLMGARGPNLTVSQLELSIPGAFSIALQWLSEARAATVLVGGVDEWCPVLGHCHQRLCKERKSGTLPPPDLKRPNTPIAEGAVFFLLSPRTVPETGYGIVESAVTGRLGRQGPDFPENALVLLGSAGHRASARRNSARRNSALIPRDREVAVYFPFYGILPVGMGFDTAIAALILREKRVFLSPGSETKKPPMEGSETPSALGSRKVCCFQVAPPDAYGMITLAPADDLAEGKAT